MSTKTTRVKTQNWTLEDPVRQNSVDVERDRTYRRLTSVTVLMAAGVVGWLLVRRFRAQRRNT